MTRCKRPPVPASPRHPTRSFVMAALALSLGALGTACGDGYGIDVLFSPESLAEQVVTVEVALVESCADQGAAGGESPVDALVVVEASRVGGSDEIGEVDPGTYGLYGRARSEACEVVAAGCTEFELEGGGDDVLELYLLAVEGPGCDSGSTCDQGRCLR